MNKFNILFLILALLPSSLFADESSLFKFNKNLYDQLRSKEGNVVISPFSISTALLMAYIGSDNKTKEEFEKVLGVDHTYLKKVKKEFEELNSFESGVELLTANSFFSDKAYKFSSSYEDDLDKYFYVEPFSVDFKNDTESARLEINEWVEDKTKDIIKDLIPPATLTSDTRGVLVNAIYFNGKWLNKFIKNATLDEDFASLDGSNTKVPFLHSTFETSYFENDLFQALTLPYEGERFSMILILPRDNSKEGFVKLEDMFDENLVATILNNSQSTDVKISIPKFKSEFASQLVEQLMELGLRSPFIEEDADFSKMSKEKGLHISSVFHKAFIEVEEEGTKAAAATAVVMDGLLARMPEEPKVFKANHPFLYLIRDSKTGLVLFMGRQSEF